MKKLLMFFGIFVTCAVLAEGFPSGTIVHCPFEDVSIEYIKQGTPVFSFDSEGSHCVERVLKIFEKDTDTLVRIQAEGENFFAAPDQLFLLSDNTWRAAVDLQIGDGLRRVGGVSSVIDLEIIDASETHAQLYTLFISGTQNFSITKSGFYVHNIVPVVIIAGGIIVESTLAIVLEKTAEIAAVAGLGYGAARLNDKIRKMKTERPSDFSQQELDEMQARQKIFVDEYNKQHLGDLHDPTKYTRQSDGTYISVEDDTWWGRIFGSGQRFVDDQQPPKNPGGKKATSCCGGGGRPPDDPNDPLRNGGFRRNTGRFSSGGAGNEKNNAQAPGKPTIKDGYKPPKNWDGKKIRPPKGGKVGWPDDKGNVWVPTGPGPTAHGGPHWDVQHPGGKGYTNVYPGGKIRPGKK